MRVAALAFGVAVLLTSALAGRAERTGRPDGAGGAGVDASTIRIGVRRGGTYDVTAIPLEEYVARVLTGEALPGSAPAAMDALAIAVRTYTEANLGRHRADGFDLCDQTHCQVMRIATPTTERAAHATSGQVLLYHNAPATIFYSASCGGRTEIPSAVWPDAEDLPYLPSRPDDGCGGGPVWSAELASSDLQRAFAATGFRGALRSMAIASRNSSGRVGTLRLDGLTPSEISGQDLRAAVGRTLGWQYIRSAAFEMRRIGDVYRMDGRGSGHGVGMCVIGSAKLAAAGESAAAILNRYYPGLDVGPFTPRLSAVPVAPFPVLVPAAPAPASRTAPPASPATLATLATLETLETTTAGGVMISLPEGDEGERGMMLALAARERDLLATTLGVPAPPRLALRVHPTTGDYERATGRPWFTAGAVVNNEVHLPPLAPLRDRGVLERMLRRQMVHLLIDHELARRPAWVREGAALYYGDGQMGTPPSVTRSSCPGDAELQRPISVGALSTAYAEARACFERQVASGRSWRDVR